MRYPDGAESWPPLPWIEDDNSVEDALGDVMIPHEGRGVPEDGEDGDGGNGADGDSSRRSGRAA